MELDFNQVVLVDSEDKVLGTMEKMEAHRKAELHRAISVFIVNSEGEWLLQRRALDKYHSKGLWSNTCCTHPALNESYKDAAKRRLKEEMGMKCELEEVHQFIYKIELEDGLWEHELDHVFVGFTNKKPKPNPEEVMDFVYFDCKELESEIAANPSQFSYWFRYVFPEVKKYVKVSPWLW